MPVPHITVCICTFKRSDYLKRLLQGLRDLQTEDRFTYSVVVTDNDAAESGRSTTATVSLPVEVAYCVEPVQNIALARNRALANARGEFIAFIDDDEIPVTHWLLDLYRACEKWDGVLGPVLPHFDEHTPEWFRKAGFYDFRKRYKTGTLLEWPDCRTGNVLLRRRVLDVLDPPFREEFGTGGEDQDFFCRAIEKGCKFAWCDEAIVYETIAPSRYKRGVLLRRALLRGRNTLRHSRHRFQNIAKSAVAVPVYTLALPILFLAGHHHFMKFLVKLADHTGRLLAVVGLNPVRERPM
jgi:succinoglycan biosynthesis protein ExoM